MGCVLNTGALNLTAVWPFRASSSVSCACLSSAIEIMADTSDPAGSQRRETDAQRRGSGSLDGATIVNQPRLVAADASKWSTPC